MTPPSTRPQAMAVAPAPTGLLHEIRKKTMQKIVKYAGTASSPTPFTASAMPSPLSTALSSPLGGSSSSPAAATLDSSLGRAIVSPRSKDAIPTAERLVRQLHRFEEHDAVLRQLDQQLGDMLQQLQGTCVAMGRVAEVFTQSFRQDNASYRLGADFLAAMKAIRRDGAHLMDQAIRFTVLDPLTTRLERHDQLRGQIAQWRRLQSELEEVQLALDFQRATRQDKEERRQRNEARLAALHQQLDPLEVELLRSLEEATNQHAVRHNVDLFTTMRLQLAIFFYQTNDALLSRLTETETEIVKGVGPTPRLSLASRSHHRVSSVSQRSVYSERTESGDDDDTDGDDMRVSTITLEDFEQGKGLLPVDEPQLETPVTVDPQAPELIVSSFQSWLSESELLALASRAVVDSAVGDDKDPGETEDPRAAKRADARQLTIESSAKATRDSESSVLSSIRRSFHDRFGSPKASEGAPRSPKAGRLRSPTSPTLAPPTSPTSTQRPPSFKLSMLSAAEWDGVEASLWALDTPTSAPPCQCPSSSAETQATSMPAVLTHHVHVLSACTQFLSCEDLARLSKVSRHLHGTLRHYPAVWKRSIRAGGLSPATRSAVWLGMLYGSMPWHSETATPHHLRSREKRRQIYEGLLLKLGAKLATGVVTQGPNTSSDDAQLVAWLQDIDVDVVRTCNRDIYAPDAIHDWDGASPCSSMSAPPAARKALVQDRIRRVLRAYVVYNPRVGYCQGMNFLVRLLMEVSDDEADCFWLFVGLSEPELDRNLYEPGLVVLQPLFARFEAFFSRQKPELFAHFQSEGVPVAAFAARWFLTFFSAFETFGPTLVVRLLDLFVIDGWRVIFSMALVVLDELEDELLASDMEAILRLLQLPRARLVELTPLRRRQLLQHALAFSITRAMGSSMRKTDETN
ncbi:hypothetical protein ATCC90586_008546 [Pythium insidiosum]|nr:hypothetical protein ATCC90586_008546 [Pythium insidiosum]